VKASKKGYSLWSASSDQTINVHFLAKSYAKHIPDSAPNSSLQIPPKTTVSRRPELRGGGSNLKRATTIAGTNLTQKDKEQTDISKVIVMAPPGTAAEGSPDPTSLQQPINSKEAQERRAQFAKRRTNSSGKKKIVVDEVRKSTSDDSTPTQTTTNLLSLPKSQKVKRTQTTFVSLRKSEGKREKTPSPDLNNIIQ